MLLMKWNEKSRFYDFRSSFFDTRNCEEFYRNHYSKKFAERCSCTFSPVALGFISAGFWSRGLSGKLSAALLATSIIGMPLP
ncbi:MULTISPECIES: hypothetical protein [unclassified Paenibacillus]|uniref:hypothetical protein n=1 Tax=unclassified Paenibacillus TaxID=185978 RepID=UPI0011605937